MTKARSILSWCAALSIALGAVLAVLDISGVVAWKADLWGGKVEVTSTHIGIGFALVGMTLGIVIILRPPRKELVVKRTVEHTPSVQASFTPLHRPAPSPDMKELIAAVAKANNMTEKEVLDMLAKLPPAPEPRSSGGYKETFEVRSQSRSEVRGGR